MGNLLGHVLYFIFKYKFTILALICYCVIAIYPSEAGVRLTLILGACSIFFIHNIIAKAKFSIVFVILFSLIMTFNAYIAFMYSSYVQVGLVASLFETSQTEAMSVLRGVLPPALILLALMTTLIYKSTRELKEIRLSKLKSAFILLIYCYALLPMVYRRVVITDLREAYNLAPVYVLQQALNHYSPLLYGNVMTVAAYQNEMQKFEEYANKEREMPKGIEVSDSEKVKKIFIVVGESATRRRMSLYGYDYPTTPFVDSLHRSDSSKVYFYNGIAAASYTRNAVPSILSTAHAKDIFRFYKEKTLLDLAKMSGYETAWFSNQARMDLWSSKGNYIGSLAGQTNHTFFSPDGVHFDDFKLVEKFKQYYKDNDDLQLFVFHLIGSHYHYTGKYDSVDEAALPGEDTLDKMYDRSIHHTDRLLKELYSLVEKNNSAALFYVSDHGEDVGVAFGHGIIPISKVQFEVPMLILNNSTLAMDSIANRFMNPQDSTINNSNSMYILSHMLGYSASESLINRAVEEGKYVIHGDDVIHQFSNIQKESLLDK